MGAVSRLPGPLAEALAQSRQAVLLAEVAAEQRTHVAGGEAVDAGRQRAGTRRKFFEELHVLPVTRAKHQRILESIFKKPTPAGIGRAEIVAMFGAVRPEVSSVLASPRIRNGGILPPQELGFGSSPLSHCGPSSDGLSRLG